uniref:Variant surface glycoprotein 1202 n=1 Tax=Trypanosoma brucei TaxID=5691 RepID=M4TB15_9TRYP|nr:variant surface glycoprotein 1202 [Trypanosoma brucei]
MPATKDQVWLMLLALPLAHVIAQNDEPVATCSEPCACGKRVKDRVGLYAEQFKEAVLKQKHNELAAAKYTLAATAGEAELRKALIPVMTASAEISTACTAAISAAAGPAFAAQMLGGQVTGIYAGINALTKITGAFKAAAAGNTNLAAAAPATATLGQTADLGCTQNVDRRYQAPTMKTENKEPAPAALTLHSEVTAKCTATAGNSCHNTQLGGCGSIEIKLRYVTTEPRKSTTWTTSSHTTDHVVDTKPLDLMGNNGTELNNKLKELREQHDLNPCSKDIRTYEAVSDTGSWKLYASKALLNIQPAEKVAEPPTLTAAETAAYGASGKDFKANIWAKVQETLVPVTENDQETLKPISTLSTTAHVYKALARVLLKQQKKEQEDQQKVSKKVDTTKDKECNGKKGDECTGECEWDKEKETCTPKKKGEAENKEKTGTTNTTGSNSFVINKASLLLAFLLI